MSFKIRKELKKDWIGNEGLAIYVEHLLNKDQWKNRLLWFNSETATYKNYKERTEKWQQKI